MRYINECSDSADRAYFALEFLKEAYENNKFNEIENMEDIFNALDISMELKDLKEKIMEYWEIMEEKKLYPGDKGYKGGTTSTRVYSKGKNIEITTIKDSDGNVKAVFVRDLFLGAF